MLIPSNFGLSDQKFSTLTLKSLFEDNNFLPKTKLETKLDIKINFLDYVNLKQIINKSLLLKDGQNRDLNEIEKPDYFCKRLYELFDPKYKGSQRFRKIFKYNDYTLPSFDSEKWEKILKVKFCDGKGKETLKSIQNPHIPRYILDFKARLILGKTQSNSQLAFWTPEYTSQACFMCQNRGDFAIATLLHTLYECPTSKLTIEYICEKFNFPKNTKAYEIILTTAKCTSNMGKNPRNGSVHNACGTLEKYNDNFTSKDFIWATVCKYFFYCHTNKKTVLPQTVLNFILIECNVIY